MTGNDELIIYLSDKSLITREFINSKILVRLTPFLEPLSMILYEMMMMVEMIKAMTTLFLSEGLHFG